MYKQITLIIFMLFVIADPAEIFPISNVRNTNFYHLRSPIHPSYLPLYNNQHLAKANSKRSLFLLKSLLQTKDENGQPKETSQKMKRCGTQIRKGGLSSQYSSKENSIRARTSNPNINVHPRTFKEYTRRANTHVRNAKYKQASSITSRIKSGTHNKDKMLLQTRKDNPNTENTNSRESREITKTCNPERYVCYCKEEHCIHRSSKKNSLRAPMSFRKAKSGKINGQRPTSHKNASPISTTNILQYVLPEMYQKNFQDFHIPILIDPPLVQQRSGINKIPLVPILYRIPSNIADYTAGNEKEIIHVGIPFASFQSEPNFLVGSNAYNRYWPNFRQNSQAYSYPPITKRSEIADPSKSITLTNYIGIPNMKANSDLQVHNATGIIGKDRGHIPRLTTEFSNNYVRVSASPRTNYSKLIEKIPTNYIGLLDNAENDTSEKRKADKTELLLKLKIPTDHICSIADRKIESNTESHFSSGMVESNLTEELPELITTSSIHNDNVRTDPNLHYYSKSITTSKTENLSKHSTDHFKTTSLVDYIDNQNRENDLNINDFSKDIEKSEINPSRKMIHQPESAISTESINRNSRLKLTTLALSDYANTNMQSIFYPTMTYNGKYMNIEECIKLFGRDVCVVSMTSPRMLVGRVQENKPNKYSEFTLPKSTIQNSIKKGTTESYPNILKAINVYNTANPCISKAGKLDISSNENLKATSVSIHTNTQAKPYLSELRHYTGLTERAYNSNGEHNIQQSTETEPFTILEDITCTPMEELTEQTIGVAVNSTRNEFLENSKSHTAEQLFDPSINNDKTLETTKPTASKAIHYSTISHNPSGDEKLDGLTPISRDINSWKSTLNKEQTTIVSHHSNNVYNFDENAVNNMIKSKTTIYPRENIHQKQYTTSQYFDNGKSNDLRTSNTNIDSLKEVMHQQQFNYDQKSRDLIPPEINIKDIPFRESVTSHDFDNSKDTTNLIVSKISTYPWKTSDALSNSKGHFYETTILPIQFKETKPAVISSVNISKHKQSSTIEPIKESSTEWQQNENNNHQSSAQYNNENLKAITDSTTNRIPFRDNTLLLNSIKKVINNFSLDDRLANPKDENTLQTQDKNLLPEILQIQNLKDILMLPQIEDTIVKKVKNILSNITNIPRSDLTNEWPHDMIRNTLRSILDPLPAAHWKLPSMTVKEHQFKDGQWITNMMTLSPVSSNKMENLQKSIRELLDFPSIVSQANHHIVQNMIVQSVENSLSNHEENERNAEEIDNSMIRKVLKNILEMLKISQDKDFLKKNNEDKNGTSVYEKDTNTSIFEETSTICNESADIYDIENNNRDPVLSEKENIDTGTMEIMNYQKTKALQNEANMLISEHSNVSLLYEEDKSSYITPKISMSTTNKGIHEIETNTGNQLIDGIKNIGIQDKEKMTIEESQETATIYHKDSWLENDPNTLTIFEPTELLEIINPDKEKVMAVHISQETSTLSCKDKNDEIERNTKYSKIDIMKKMHEQDDEGVKHEEPLKTTATWHKAILQNDLSILTTPAQSNLKGNEKLHEEALKSSTNEDIYEIKENIRNQVLNGIKKMKNNEMQENITIYDKNNSLENDLGISKIFNNPDVLETTKSYNEEIVMTDVLQETPTSVGNEGIYETEKDIECSILNTAKIIYEQDDAATEHDESLKEALYSKSISRNNPNISETTPLPNLIESKKLYEERYSNVLPKEISISPSIFEHSYGRGGDIIDPGLKMKDLNTENQGKKKSWKNVIYQQPKNDAGILKVSVQSNLRNDKECSNIYISQETSTSELTRDEDFRTMEHTAGTLGNKILNPHIDEKYNEIIKSKEPQKAIMTYYTVTSSSNNIRITSITEDPNLSVNGSLDAENNTIASQHLDINVQEITEKPSHNIFLGESSKTLLPKSKDTFFTEITNVDKDWRSGTMIDLNRTSIETMKQDIMPKAKSLYTDKVSDKKFVARPNTILSINNATRINTTNLHNKNYFDEHVKTAMDLSNEQQATKSKTNFSSKYDEIDPVMVEAICNIKQPPISYYSPDDRTLEYIKSHRIGDKNLEATIPEPVTNFMRKTSTNSAEISHNIILGETLKTKTETETKIEDEMNMLNDNISSPISTANLGSSVNVEHTYITREPEIVSLSAKNILRAQQQKFATENIIKINEVTTEVQKTYEKTIYLKTTSLDNDNSEVSVTIANYKPTNCNNNNNSNSYNNSYNIHNNNTIVIDNKSDNLEDTIRKSNEEVRSDIGSSFDDTLPLQLSSSSETSNDISELQKSQLYYINDDVKLPLEIKRLKDGSYALSISKNICEQILKRERPCCVPLQGYIVRSPRKIRYQESVHRNVDDQSDQSVNQLLPDSLIISVTTEKNTLLRKNSNTKKETNASYFLNDRRKRDLIDNNLPITAIPVIDFIKKYNLKYDFDEQEVLWNETVTDNEIQTYKKPLMKIIKRFEHDRSNVKNLDDNTEIKENGLLNKLNAYRTNEYEDLTNIQEREDISEIKSENSMEDSGLQETYVKVKRPEMAKEFKLHKLGTKEYNMNDEQIIISENQTISSTLQKSNVLKEEVKPTNKEITSEIKSPLSKHSDQQNDINDDEEARKYKNEIKNSSLENTKILDKQEGKKYKKTELAGLTMNKTKNQLVDNDNQNVSEIEIFEEKSGRPYRYQRNVGDITNKGIDVIKNVLYWIKDLLLSANES